MQKRRIFIAINLPAEIKQKLVNYQRKWIDLSPKFIRWTRKENLHITLLFIGHVNDDETYHICKKVRETAKNHNPFFIQLERIILGPPEREPRMFWVQGEKNENLAELQNDLRGKIGQRSGARHNAYRPHITLAMFKPPLVEQLPEKVNDSFKMELPVETVEIMQSNLERSGAEYSVLESVALGI